MNPDELEQRLADVEGRLARIEAKFPAPAQPRPAAPSAPAVRARKDPPEGGSAEGHSLATSVLGWGGAFALVLAAAYLIRLAIDSGWLTPVRQVAMAAIAGLALVAGGFALRGTDRRYAGLLPAAGVAILFLCIYGAHLYYGLIGPEAAGAAVVIVCAVSLWLCRAFASDLYALFAVAGSYSAPLLLSGLRGSITDLVIYFSAWSAVFGVYAVWHGRRVIYLLALYLALIGFDIARHEVTPREWIAALVFQTAQFAIFGTATAVFSVRNRLPLTAREALSHLPPLLLFYFIQYNLLRQHLPAIAPWIAVASAAAVAALYGFARAGLKRPLPGGELLLWCYVALVLVHAGYIESVPREWAPWVALVAVPAVAVASLRRGSGLGASWPIWAAVGLIFVANYLRAVFDIDVDSVPGRKILPLAYAALLYLGYWLVRGREDFRGTGLPLLYAGHVSALSAALHFLDERIVASAAWGLLALACLILSLRDRDRILGQSSLLVFGATAAKVLLYDLSGAAPLARIFSLLVLGLTFYFGGMLYQRMLGEKPGA